jgi:hypothetical protein
VAHLVERHGQATAARAITRSVNVTDRLLVVARPTKDDAGRVRLDPPEGGYLLTNLALADAMRLLGGPRPRLAAAGVLGLGISIALLLIGGIGAFVSALVA